MLPCWKCSVSKVKEKLSDTQRKRNAREGSLKTHAAIMPSDILSVRLKGERFAG